MAYPGGMKKLLDGFGMMAGGWAGWWLGSLEGLTLAVVLSAVGSGVGMYAIHKLAQRYLE